MQQLLVGASRGHRTNVRHKLMELEQMLQLSPWKNYPLTVSFTSEAYLAVARELDLLHYPPHMKVQVCSVDQLPTTYQVPLNYKSNIEEVGEWICAVCDESGDQSTRVMSCYYEQCSMKAHVSCLSDQFHMREGRNEPALMPPNEGNCPICNKVLQWPWLSQYAQSEISRTKSKDTNSLPNKPSGREEEKHLDLDLYDDEYSLDRSFNFSDIDDGHSDWENENECEDEGLGLSESEENSEQHSEAEGNIFTHTESFVPLSMRKSEYHASREPKRKKSGKEQAGRVETCAESDLETSTQRLEMIDLTDDS